MVDWVPQQAKALDLVGNWIKDKSKPFFQLGGYAGTGKSFLAKHFAASLNQKVYYAASTGKAAHVLVRNGIDRDIVSTIHKLIYNPKDKSKQKLKDLEAERAKLLTHNPVPRVLIAKIEKAIDMEKANLTRPMFQLNTDSPLKDAGLLILDEYSQIEKSIGEDLLSFGVPILALGDPFQLPPVAGVPFFSEKPDFMLTDIRRQAQDNPIIRMSMEIREGRGLRAGTYGDSRVVSYGSLSKEELAQRVLAADQLLVGRNATRISSNNRVRQLLNFEGALPKKDDKLVCLRNNSDLGLLNGQIWKATRDSSFDGRYVNMAIQEEDEATNCFVSAHPHYFHGDKPQYYEKKDAQEFDYGYALTVHKAQGSQWDNVTLLDEWFSTDRDRWLYTGVTRAAERIDVIKM